MKILLALLLLAASLPAQVKRRTVAPLVQLGGKGSIK